MAKNPRAAECQYRIYSLFLGTILHAWENTNDFPAGAIFDGGTRGVSQAVVKVVNGRARWGGIRRHIITARVQCLYRQNI